MAKLSRRKIIVGAGAAGGLIALARRPSDVSGPRDPYFERMQAAIKAAGIATPTLVIDKVRLNANIDTLISDLPSGMGYRIVAKSLPCQSLLSHIRTRAKTDRLMTFNLPMLQTLAAEMPDAHQLLGKPMPVQAAKIFLQAQSADNIEWLIDTPQRLGEYETLAASLGTTLNVNLELDIGLHRGGFVPGDSLDATLTQLKSSKHLNFAGFMGYEPHIAKIPTLGGMQKRSKLKSWDLYTDSLKAASAIFGDGIISKLTRNAAGSPTYRFYKDTAIASEISAGSTLVKPTDFDTDILSNFLPASFIATPVIKSVDQTNIPGLEFMGGWNRFWNPNTKKTVFTYGGHWLALPEDPPGLEYNPTFGRSSNQEMLNGGAKMNLAPDDFVFLRPTQSEAVFLQFGDIAVYEDGKILDFWPVFPMSA